METVGDPDFQELKAQDVVAELEDAQRKPAPEGEVSYNVTDRTVEVSADMPVKIKVSYFPDLQGVNACATN